jgi:hypothetical protein
MRRWTIWCSKASPKAIDNNTQSLEGKRDLLTQATLLIGLSFVLVGIVQLLSSAQYITRRLVTLK